MKFDFLKNKPGGAAVEVGFALLALFFGLDFFVNGDIKISWLSMNFGVKTPEILNSILIIGFKVAIAFIAYGLIFLGYYEYHEIKKQNRKRTFIYQLKGLNDSNVAPISEFTDANSQISPQIIDVREDLRGGYRINDAIKKIDNVSKILQTNIGQLDAADYSIYAGGLAPVPLLFQFGNVLEDEGVVHWMDWNREQRKWINIKNGAHLSKWKAPVLVDINEKDEIVLIIDVSYQVEDSIVNKAFPDLPIIKWGPQDKLLGVVADEQSGDEICSAFRKLLVDLSDAGVKNIRLIIAASSSLVMKLGSTYDPRNMVPVTVYQYEKELENPYPWGIRLKTIQGEKSTIFVSNTK